MFTGQLRQAVRTGRLPHAALITGADAPARRAATLLAAAHNCTAPESWRPCCEQLAEDGGLCQPCQKTVTGSHPDVDILDCLEGKVTVERVRSLTASMAVLPNEGRVKVYVIHGAQLLSPVCQNALLAALEEPPKSVAFILTCEHRAALLPTVLSRLTRWDAGAEDGQAPDADASGEVASRVSAILAAVDAHDEQSLLLAALACDKLNREQAALLLDELRAGLIGRAEGAGAAAALGAARRLGDLRETLARNTGIGHVCGAAAVILVPLIET